MKQVIVVTDRIAGAPRRACFWTSEFLAPAQREPLIISVSEEIAAGRNPASSLFSERHHEIVVNWDALNGDPVYGSDVAQSFFRHYRPDLVRWLQRGKLLVLEGQHAAETAVRAAYEAVVEKPPRVSDAEAYGREVFIGDEQDSYLAPEAEDRPLFTPSVPLASLTAREDKAGHLFRGYFSMVRRPWIPLLYGKKNNSWGTRPPVAVLSLVKGREACGGIILTTLHMAEANALPIFQYLIGLRSELSTLSGMRTRERSKLLQKQLGAVLKGVVKVGGKAALSALP